VPDVDLTSLIDASKKKAAESAGATGTNLNDLIAKSREKMEETLPRNDSPHVERPWYDFWSKQIEPTDLELADEREGNRRDQEEAARQITNTFEHPASIVTRELSPGLGMMAGGAQVASPLARAGLGALAGGSLTGIEALSQGASLPEAGKQAAIGAAVPVALEGAGYVLGGLGRGAKGAANRKLAERALPSAELNDIRADEGGAGVQQAGQDIRDLGVTKPRSVGDFFRGNTPLRMSENSREILEKARPELKRARMAITGAPARDVSEFGNDPNPITVGQAPVSIEPLTSRLHSEADRLDYARNPDKARTYRDLASELTTPVPVREPAPVSSDEPLMSESQPRMRRREGPRASDGSESDLPFESRMPEQPPDPAVLSSEPTGPIEPNAPPMSSQAMDDGNLSDLPAQDPAVPPGYYDSAIERFPQQPKPYMANTPEVSTEPNPFETLMDNAPTPRNPQAEAGAIPVSENPPAPDTYQGVATKPLGRPLDLPADDGSNLLLTPPDHAISSPYNVDALPVDQSYWPAPYEMSRNEPPMPPQEPGLAPAKQTVLESTPRFKGTSPPPGLALDTPRDPSVSLNLLADRPATALYPDAPPSPTGELAPLGMSRRAPTVGPVQRNELSQLTGARPTTSNLATGAAESIDVSDTSPVSSPIEPTSFPPTPRPMTPVDSGPKYTMDQLMSMRSELGNQVKNFDGRPLTKTEGDMNAALRDAWKGTGDSLTGAFDQHVNEGNITPAQVQDYRNANKTFTTIADVNKSLATRTNQDFKAPSAIQGNETILGGGTKATLAAAKGMYGLNAQYGVGQGLEGAGTVARAGSDLARAASGLGWIKDDNKHPEVAKAAAENPGAPKAAVEQKANDNMKESIFDTWYNKLQSLVQ
jgi:hypothetical protein